MDIVLMFILGTFIGVATLYTCWRLAGKIVDDKCNCKCGEK